MKLDLGCGPNKQNGFIGVDISPFDGVDIVHDLATKWPWEDNSVDEIYCSHTIEHFNSKDRIHFVNEMYRVLKPNAKAIMIAPHWSSCRAYGDLTHEWPPIAESWFFHLKKDWRNEQAPHGNRFYTCDFEATWGYGLHESLSTRNQEFQQFAVNFYKEAIQDIHFTLIKK